MEQLLKEYEYYLKSEKMMSPNSISSYINDCTNYVSFLVNNCGITDMDDVTADEIRDFLTTLKKKKMKSSSMQVQLMSKLMTMQSTQIMMAV